jgi:hypothetical protein
MTTRLDKRQVIAAKTACGDNTWLVEGVNPLDCASGQLNFYSNVGGTDSNLCSNGSININTWYHVAFVYDGANRMIYINGQLDASQADSGNFPTNDQPVRIGAWGTFEGCGGTPTRFFYGSIDEVAIFSRALTPEEIQQHYLNGLNGLGYEEGIAVDIDIKPGSDPNSINLDSVGVIPVAILSSADFDATTVNPDTVFLAGAKVKMLGKSDKLLCHEEDVNNDALLDLVCQVLTEESLIETGESVAVLEAETYDGTQIRGEDAIKIVP